MLFIASSYDKANSDFSDSALYRTDIPSGIIMMRAAPMRRPAPNTATKFMILFEKFIFEGKIPKRNVKINIDRERQKTVRV